MSEQPILIPSQVKGDDTLGRIEESHRCLTPIGRQSSRAGGGIKMPALDVQEVECTESRRPDDEGAFFDRGGIDGDQSVDGGRSAQQENCSDRGKDLREMHFDDVVIDVLCIDATVDLN